MKDPFMIHENKSVGPVKFGMSYIEVREAIGGSPNSRCAKRRSIQFQRTPHLIADPDSPESDVFEEQRIVAYYNIYSGLCDALDFFGTISPTFRGKELLGEHSIEFLRLWLNSMGGDCKIRDNFVASYEFGIKLIFTVYMDADQYHQVKDYPPKEIVIFSRDYAAK